MRLKAVLAGVAVLALVGGTWAATERFVVNGDARGVTLIPFGYAKDGRPITGVLYQRHREGGLRRLAFLWKGRLHLKDYQWYENGRRHMERSYRHGKPHGEYRAWYRDGAPMEYAVYADGEPQGEMWQWHPNGSTIGFSYYENGREVAIKRFNHRQLPFHNYVRADDGRIRGMKGDRKCDRENPLRM